MKFFKKYWFLILVAIVICLRNQPSILEAYLQEDENGDSGFDKSMREFLQNN